MCPVIQNVQFSKLDLISMETKKGFTTEKFEEAKCVVRQIKYIY